MCNLENTKCGNVTREGRNTDSIRRIPKNTKSVDKAK